ncbi:4'-phosphopantetheinyl transferase family protein [Allohahella marinimesophila]|uniref:4'-phosphopantetheinyl transferase family protein n=1 Tax=Allohahella marinimesophila TaxID=1054972 RepID=UPI0031DD8874
MILQPNTVGIYLISLSGEIDSVQHSLDSLSPAEQQRAALITPPRARRRFELARFYLRQLLGERLDMAPSAVPISIGLNGKPELALDHARFPCHFSLSHSGGWVAIAISSEPVGVDLETRCPSTWKGIARRFFTPSEQQWLETADDQQNAFVAAWTMKEAAVKLYGDRLLTGLRAFQIQKKGWVGGEFSAQRALIAASTWCFPRNLWLSATVFREQAVNNTLYSVFEKTAAEDWLINERELNQYLMVRSCASEQD